MLEAAQWMDRQFTVDGSYLSADAERSDISVYSTDFYTLSISASTASTYTIQGAPTGAQSGDSCGTLINIGVKGDRSESEDCWQ